MTSELIFFVNGARIVEKHADPEWTLLYYLRNKLKLCGTKLGCGEGGCGACTVMVSRYDRKLQMVKHLAINACLAPICSLHGLAITTVEGIGSTKTKLHPVQERIAKAHGLQCGFCTPGFVMSMYTLLRNCSTPVVKDLEATFQGNLCRCTGYRPIIEGYKTFISDVKEVMLNGYLSTNKQKDCGMGKNCCKLNGVCKDDEDKLFDSNTFLPYDPTQEPIFPPELKLYDTLNNQNLIFEGKNVTWYRPTTLRDLLGLKQKYPEAKIVVGNTEIGVEVNIKHYQYSVLIQPNFVSELNVVETTENGIKIGASVTLLEVEEAIEKIVNTMPEYKTRIFVAIKKILHYFGGKQIRSVASIGGNIMTSSPISDLNPIFLAAEAKLELHSKDRGLRLIAMNEHFFTGYRKNVVKYDEILVAIYIPFTIPSQYFYAYKQSRRRDDDIAIVNFALNVILQPKTNLVQKVCLAFGGMAPVTVTTPTLCKFLLDKPWNTNTLNRSYKYLLQDLPLASNAPGGMIEYRRSLTLSFFFKAFLKVSEQIKDCISSSIKITKDKSALNEFQEKIPQSAQYFEINPSNERIRAVGKPIPHISGLNLATGEAVFCDDIPTFQNELYMAVVKSTKAHARILNIDFSEALNCDGVYAFFSSKDLPSEKNQCGIGCDEEILVTNIMRCQGLIIGVIIADDQLVAQSAASKVKITYEELEAIVTIEDAIRHKSFHSETPLRIAIGDIDNAFKDASHIIEGDCRTGAQEHFYLETQSVIAVPKGEDHELEIFCSTQDPSGVTALVSMLLDVPQHRIVTRVKRMGGSFGGKETRAYNLPLLAAFAAHKFNRPVRCMLNRNDDMVITGTRHPYYIKYKTALNNNGKILGSKVLMYSNGGYSIDLSFNILDNAMNHFNNAYNIPAIQIEGFVCKTNLPSCTAFRGFGAPQAMFAGENMIRNIAEFLDKDPVEVTHINLYREEETSDYNQKTTECNLGRCWNQCITYSDFLVRKQEVEKFNRENKWRKRGISIVPVKYAIGVKELYFNQAGALIHIYTDGSILLSHGGIEMGQGLHTKMLQVASTALEVLPSKIHIGETSTDKVPNTLPTIASVGSDLYGGAVLAACEIINERLKPYKEQNPGAKWEDWVIAAYKDRVSLSASGFFRINRKVGETYDYHSYGAACSEIEIDCLTGDHQVLRTDIVMDVGKSLNPAVDIGQIEGAFTQGYGLFVQEEMLYSPKGEVLTTGPGTYKIPSVGNMPLEFNVSLLKGSSNIKAIYSSKGIGEPPLFLSSSIYFAIREAIKAARIDRGLNATGFKLDAPATAAKIRMGCQDHLTAMVEECKPDGSFVPWNVIP